ncbi:hypothetical protein GCM10008995_05300 [Halobellus salinus]|uniref:Uncharacterized protein n=1 Tax=Halobellus salinus TaxID=931585 RepID=A0A830E805_9EURY|nr:hypothetical protein [Halobellus salinus]GGI98363.1 hypothetical protein GCM10008995_05300 [Halobellus salinus]
MPPVSMPPSEDARAIFRRLGYSVSGDGPEFVAERKWRTVRVTAVSNGEDLHSRRALADGGEPSTGYRFRCFVAPKSATGDVRNRLRSVDPTYEWAVIGVNDDGEYDVYLPSAA